MFLGQLASRVKPLRAFRRKLFSFFHPKRTRNTNHRGHGCQNAVPGCKVRSSSPRRGMEGLRPRPAQPDTWWLRSVPAGPRGSRTRWSAAAAGSSGEPQTVGREREGRRLPGHCQQFYYWMNEHVHVLKIRIQMHVSPEYSRWKALPVFSFGCPPYSKVASAQQKS